VVVGSCGNYSDTGGYLDHGVVQHGPERSQLGARHPWVFKTFSSSVQYTRIECLPWFATHGAKLPTRCHHVPGVIAGDEEVLAPIRFAAPRAMLRGQLAPSYIPDSIRFAARNRLCVSLRYQGVQRIVELSRRGGRSSCDDRVRQRQVRESPELRDRGHSSSRVGHRLWSLDSERSSIAHGGIGAGCVRHGAF